MSGSTPLTLHFRAFFVRFALGILVVPFLLGLRAATIDSTRIVMSRTGYPPIIEVTKPGDDSTHHSQTTEIRLDYYPDPDCFEPQEPGQPDPCGGDESTLQVWVNGTEKTSEFTTHGGWANSTSVVMPDNQWSTIRGKICNGFGCDEDTIQVYIETEPAPEVSLLATDDQVHDRGLCAAFPAGPAASWACDEFLITHATVPYFSLGKARGISLVYSSELAEKHVLIHADVAFPWESTSPDYFGVRLKRDGTWVDPEIYLSSSAISTADSADTRRVSLTLKLGSVAPGLLDLIFAANSYFSGAPEEGVDSMVFAWDTVAGTTISRGWAIPGLARVIPLGDGNLIWSDGAGTTHYYLRENTYSYYKIEGVLAELDSIPTSTSEKTWKRTLPDGTVEYYNDNGQLSRIEGVNPADTTKFAYSGGLIQEIIDATGKKIEFNYTSGQLSEIIYPGGASGSARDTTALQYDGSQRLYRIYDPDGLYTQFTYDGTTWRITERIDRSGATTDYRWYDVDYTRRVERVVLPTGTDSIRYAAPQLLALPDTTNGALSPSSPASTPPRRFDVEGSLVNARSDTSTFKVNTFGSLMDWVDALDRATTYERDVNSLLTSKTGPDSIEWFWLRVGELGLVRTSNHTGTDSAVSWVYPGQWPNLCPGGYPCHPLKQIRSRGYGNPKDTTEYYYTGNRLSQAVHPGGSSTFYSYGGAFSQLSQITDPAGHKKKYEYDGTTGDLLRSFKEWGGGTQGDSVRYWYDSKGRVDTTTVERTGGRSPYGNVYTAYEYDRLNRVRKIHRVRKGLLGQDTIHTVIYAYDDTARTLTVTDPKGQSQVFTFDELGRVIRRDDPAGAYETFAYDGNGNLTSWTTRRGDTITYSYDALNRLISKGVPDIGSTTYGYHGLRGTLDTIFTPDAKNIREFDSRGRMVLDSSWVTGISGGWRAVRYTFDPQANLETLTTPWDTFTHEPSPVPEPYGAGFRYVGKTWANALGDTTEWVYDEEGLLAKIVYPNSQEDTIAHDERHLVTGVGDVSYTRTGRGGRISQMTVSNPTEDRIVKYTYDFKNQLVEAWDSVAGQAPIVQSFAYDSAGNRTGAGYVYAEGNRLLATPTDTFAYDDSGNLTWWKTKASGDYKTFTWDPEEHLTEVKLFASGGGSPYRTVSFSYDGLGRRVKKVTSGDQIDTARYVYDGSEVSAELTSSGGWVRRYTPHPTLVDQMISVRDSTGSTYNLHQDGVGSVVKVTNSLGTIVSRYRYEVFGAHVVIGAEGYASAILWQGREYDRDTGLYYFRERYYSADLGRFLSEDPLIGSLYRFALNDPVNFRDPSGLNHCTFDGGPGEVGDDTAEGGLWETEGCDHRPGDETLSNHFLWEIFLGGFECGFLGTFCGYAEYGLNVGALQTAGDFAAGFGDFITFGGTKKIRELWDCADCVNYDSGVYTAGEFSGGATAVGLAGLTVARIGLGVTSRVAHHSTPHPFRFIGRWSHIQINVWRIGVKGSGRALRIPLPWR